MYAKALLLTSACGLEADPACTQVSHSVAALTRARTFERLYVSQLVDVIQRANVHDHESAYFDDVDYYSQENEREQRRPWTRCAPAPLLLALSFRSSLFYLAASTRAT